MSKHRGHLRRDGRTWRLVLRHASEPTGGRTKTSVRLGTVDELPTKSAARAAADRWIESVHPRQLHAGAVVPWSTCCDRYIDTVLAMQATGTRNTSRSIIERHLRDAFPGPVHAIARNQVQAWAVDQLNTGAAPATIGARFKVLRRILRWATEQGLTASPPSAGSILLPKVEQVHETVRDKAFTTAEAFRVIEAAPDPDGTAFALARFAGLRCSEVLGLTWPLVNLETGALTIRQQALDGRLVVLKSAGSNATLQAPPPLLARLRAFREAWQPNPQQLLFADEAGKPWAAAELRARLYELLDRLGIHRRGVHAFRHCTAIAMAEAGVNPECIRRAMRHSSLRVTAIYLSASAEDIAAGLERGAKVHASTA